MSVLAINVYCVNCLILIYLVFGNLYFYFYYLLVKLFYSSNETPEITMLLSTQLNSFTHIDDRNVTTRKTFVGSDHQVISVVVPDTSKSVDITGDSVLNDIYAKGTSPDGNVTIFRHPGATSEQLEEYVVITLVLMTILMMSRLYKTYMICHIGSNDNTNDVETVQNLQTIRNRIKKITRN